MGRGPEVCEHCIQSLLPLFSSSRISNPRLNPTVFTTTAIISIPSTAAAAAPSVSSAHTMPITSPLTEAHHLSPKPSSSPRKEPPGQKAMQLQHSLNFPPKGESSKRRPTRSRVLSRVAFARTCGFLLLLSCSFRCCCCVEISSGSLFVRE